jgi:glycosyltransferase involved in cell wall biosynthesis
MEKKLPVSCIVVNLNESKRLHECLQSISFCDELIFVDLGSTDNSLEIAGRYTDTIIKHPLLFAVEKVRLNIIDKTKHDWILIIDPDEEIDKQLSGQITELFYKLPGDVSMIGVPWLFYYKGKPLKGTVWGEENKTKSILIKKEGVEFPTQVHFPHIPKPGFRKIELERHGNNVLHHYWMDSFDQLLEKHRRHLKVEGENRYFKGMRYSISGQFYKTITSFLISFFKKRGYKSGLNGLFLSGFYSWYIFNTWKQLKKYQESQTKAK